MAKEYMEFILFKMNDGIDGVQSMREMVTQVYRISMQLGRFIEVEGMIRLHFKKFGYVSSEYDMVEHILNQVPFGQRIKNQFDEVMAKVKKEIDEAREIQMGGMYG